MNSLPSPPSPKVTVLMPVYNGEQYLKDAIESILTQTFTDFEFLIIDDGSLDRSVEIISSYDDPRINLIHNGKNLGLINTLNKGLKLSRGQYVARMDCDDISLPDRLNRQVAFMDSNPHVGISGTWIRHFGGKSRKSFFLPTDHERIKCGLLFHTMLAHPSLMLRKKSLVQNNLYYDPAYKNAEDYELLVRAMKYLTLRNIGEILLLYRIHDNQVGQRYHEGQIASARLIWQIQLKTLHIDPTEKELHLHQSISTGIIEQNEHFLIQAEKWLLILKSSNSRFRFYSDVAFESLILERWIKCCYRVHGFSVSFITRCFSSTIIKETKKKYNAIIKIFLLTISHKIRSIFYTFFSRNTLSHNSKYA